MRLYRVNLDHYPAAPVTQYVLAAGFDQAVTVAAYSSPYVGVSTANATVQDLGEPLVHVEAAPVTAPLVPAVPINKSVTAAHLVCLEDGLTFRSMKRHLAKLGMTPDQYRTKWGLPSDYPMVAPNYSAKRSQLAKDNGLGRK